MLLLHPCNSLLLIILISCTFVYYISAFLTFIVSCFTCMIVSLPVIFREHYMHAKAVTVTIVLLYYTFITQHTYHNKLHGPTDNSPPFGVFSRELCGGPRAFFFFFFGTLFTNFCLTKTPRTVVIYMKVITCHLRSVAQNKFFT